MSDTQAAGAGAGVRIVPIPALEDNYMYLIVDVETGTAGIIDPVAPAAVAAAVEREQVQLTMILTTHSHWDHHGGNEEMVKTCPSINVVYGGRGDDVQACTAEVDEGDVIQLGATQIRVLSTPCHTAGHVCYTCDGHVFTGDTMFVGGCGNFNTGTPAQMVEAFDKLLALPDDTKVWVGHEYTRTNFLFAAFADPENSQVQEKLKWVESVKSIHAGGTGTIPSTIGAEKATNPFARIDTEAMRTFTQADSRVEIMRLVRKGKDDWGRARRAAAAAAKK